MNRTWKSIFSVLLSVALLLPMVPAARAEGTVSGKAVKVVSDNVSDYNTSADVTAVELTTNDADNTIYYRSDANNGTITVTATVTTTPSTATYSGPITWQLDENAPLAGLPLQGTVTDNQAKVTLRATDPGANGKTVDLKATVSGHSHTIKITVKQDKVTGILFSKTEETVQVNKSVQLSFNKTPSYPSGVSVSPKITYSSNNEDVAKVSSSGLVVGRAEGEAVIRAYIDDQPIGNSVKIYVNSAATSFTGKATLRNKFSMESIYSSFRDEFIKTFPTTPTLVTFSDLSGNGTLRDKNGEAIKFGGSYKLSDFQEMYLDPTNEGSFKFTAAMTDADGVNKLSATITITITAPSASILIPIDGSANYSFARVSADPNGKTGVQLIKEAIGAFGSLEFGAISSESSSVGALYTGTPVSNENRVSNGTVVSYNAIDELYFTPTRPGTYRAPFTARDGSNGYGAIVCTGELILPVDGSSLDITVNLDSVKPYTFSEKPSGSTTSLYSQLLSAINGSIGGSWGGIKFDGAASASSNGTLHESSSHSRAISKDDYIAQSAISQLYYVPARSGTYEITYGVYATAESTRVITSGKLTIKTSTIPAGASDITYTTSVKDSVTLRESDFIDFFQRENGSKYQLSYVVFKEYDGDGTFYHGANSFLPYSSADFYTSTYTGSVPTNARYLDRVSFTAPSDAGYTAVLFTCYGGTAKDSTDKVTTGKLCIYYTANNVPAVTYNAFGVASVSLKESDFATVYNAAMKTSVSKPTFNIQFLDSPDKGSLYYYYSTSGRRALTMSNISGYTFSINDSTGVSVENVSYEASRNGTGTDEITYLATAPNGATLFIGTIQFKLSTDLTLSVTNDGGSNFQLDNFYSASDSDPVLYVTFLQPSAGKVYVYADGRYTAVSSSTKLYTVSPADGQYPLTSAFYAPKANEAGTASLKYTLHRKSGASGSNTITVNVQSKLASGTFGDVKDVFSWAANSIDFASKMGLVNGTQLNPPLFSPANTMRRSDFVLMLYRLAGSPAVSGTLPYTDVPAGKYYYNSAVWAYQNDIMRNVTANGLYNPEGALTRQDFAQILFNYTKATGGNTANNASILSYSDAASVSANTLEGVTWAVANGYITSAVTGALYIEPTRSATRAEISTLLHRYLTY